MYSCLKRGIEAYNVSVRRVVLKRGVSLTCMTHACVVNLYPHFMGFGRRNLDIFNAKVLARLPSHRRLSLWGRISVSFRPGRVASQVC
jgi:hypothetical protein